MATVTGGDAAEVIHQDGDGALVPDGYVEVVGVTARPDVIEAGRGADIVYARAGADTITGGRGADTLYGGRGDDWFNVGGVSALAAGEVIDGGKGVNTLQFTPTVSGGVIDLAAATMTNVSRLFATALTAPTTIRMSSAQLADLTQIEGTVPGNFFRDPPHLAIVLSDQADLALTNLQYRYLTISATVAADAINMSGVFSAVRFNGGEGSDEISLEVVANSAVTLDGGAGDDHLTVSADAGTYSRGEFWGRDGDDFVRGTNNGGSFYGGLGADTLFGGDGFDDFWIQDAESISGLFEVFDGGGFDDRFITDLEEPAYLDLRLASFTGIEKFQNFSDESELCIFEMTSDQIESFLLFSSGGGRVLVHGDLNIVRSDDEFGEGIYDTHFIFGESDDVFTYTGGSIAGVTISGGGGEDFVFLGGFDDDFGKNDRKVAYGDAGDDNLHVRYGTAQLYGGDGNDKLVGHERPDTLDGGAGDDVLIGEGLRDRLYGGTGSDRFVFRADNHSRRHNNDNKHDIIYDFVVDDGEIIDIEDLDADDILTGNQSFFLADAFTGLAGQLVQLSDGLGNTSIMGDTDGDGKGDFKVVLIGEHVLTEANFLL